MKNTRLKYLFAALALTAVSTLSAQQGRGKFEIALGLNAVDVYLNNGYGLNAKAEESFISDIFTTNDWNINSKARDTYTDVGNKESSLPPISLRAAYYFSEKWAAGMHFSANYLDIIDLCYNAVGLPDMDFTNLEAFLRFSPIEAATITPFAQINMGRSAVGDRSNMHAGVDLGATLWIAEGIGLSYIAGAKTMFGTDLSEYIQHTFELTYRFGEGDIQRHRTVRPRLGRSRNSNKRESRMNSITTLNPAPSYIDEEIPKIEHLSVYKRYPFLVRDIAKVSRGIFFAFNSAELNRPEVTDFILPDVITEMNKRPNVKITVTGHTDLVGSEGYNYKLSLARAQAVADFLIKGGIARERITIRALGENEPVVKSESEAVLNRRVVITEDRE